MRLFQYMCIIFNGNILCTHFVTHRVSVALFPSPHLFWLHEEKSQGLVTKVT